MRRERVGTEQTIGVEHIDLTDPGDLPPGARAVHGDHQIEITRRIPLEPVDIGRRSSRLQSPPASMLNDDRCNGSPTGGERGWFGGPLLKCSAPLRLSKEIALNPS